MIVMEGESHHALADQLQAAYANLWRTIGLLDLPELTTAQLENNYLCKLLKIQRP